LVHLERPSFEKISKVEKMRGGSGRGQGRKRGSRNKRKAAELEKLAAGGEMPLDYLLRVMRDPKTTRPRADRLAIIALPYCHAKLMSKPEGDKPNEAKGKKAQAAAAADTAGKGTEWGSDLDSPTSSVN
jgi:hypothetical protein